MSATVARRRPPHRGAFTLLEVLIVIALAGALLGSMFAFLNELLRSRSRALDYTARQLAAATLIDRVESDLAASVVGDATLGAGVDGNATRLSILTRGVAAHLAPQGIDGGVLGDLQKVEYRFQAGPGQIAVRRSTGELAGARSTVPPTTAPRWAEIGPAFRVRFRYHDGSGWSDTFDSLSAGGLPAAVEIAVWYHAWPGEDETTAEAAAAGAESDRLTFDTNAGFDDAAYARQSDMDSLAEPLPDRFRVIVIPDASADDPLAPGEAAPEIAALGAGP